MKIIRVTEFGDIPAPLRNIRASIDGKQGVFDLVPERVLEPGAVPIDEPNPIIRKLLVGARPVVEGFSALRIEFDYLYAVAVDADVDGNLFGGLRANWSDAPRFEEGKPSFFPLLEIIASPWKAQLPEWRGRDRPEVRHIRMISAECSYDILGEPSRAHWIENNLNPDG